MVTEEIWFSSSFWLMDGDVLAKQRGVMRVNCMDCLGEEDLHKTLGATADLDWLQKTGRT